jgi:hypothetical protein
VVERYPFDDIADYIRTKRAEFGARCFFAGCCLRLRVFGRVALYAEPGVEGLGVARILTL